MNTATQSTKVESFLSRVHDIFMKQYNVDVKGLAKDTSLNSSQKYQKMVSQINTALVKQNAGFQLPVLTDTTTTYCDTVWVTEATANAWGTSTGASVETAVNTCETYLGFIDYEGDNTATIAMAASAGIVGVGSAWMVGGVTLMSSILGAGAAAAIAAGAGTAAGVAAAGTAAAAAATAAGLSSAAASSAAVAAIAAASTGAGTAAATSFVGGLVSCLAAFAVTPAGIIVIAAAVLLLIAGIVAWLIATSHDIGGIVINNTDDVLTLYGGASTSTGIYCSEGAMFYFPGVYDETNPNNPVLLYKGIPARKVFNDNDTNTDNVIGVGFFGVEATSPATQGSTGFFSMTNNNGSNLAFMFSNRKAGYSSGVYMAFDPLTDDAETLYAKLYKNKTLQYSSNDSSVYSISCACDGPGGAEAFGVYFLTDPTWGIG
jgi:hypothetical protein